MKAIETEYAGVRFRSRLEARWAVFFDALGIRWEYEREGYELPSGRYLPDFWLPELVFWIEIKGRPPTPEEELRCDELANATHTDVCLWVGSPLDLPEWWNYKLPYTPSAVFSPRPATVLEEGDTGYGPPGGASDYDYWPCVCPGCGRIGITYNGRGGRVCGPTHANGSDKAYSYDNPRILGAIDAVRAHCFWNPTHPQR